MIFVLNCYILSHTQGPSSAGSHGISLATLSQGQTHRLTSPSMMIIILCFMTLVFLIQKLTWKFLLFHTFIFFLEQAAFKPCDKPQHLASEPEPAVVDEISHLPHLDAPLTLPSHPLAPPAQPPSHPLSSLPLPWLFCYETNCWPSSDREANSVKGVDLSILSIHPVNILLKL